ncbi:ATP-dependent nuclease [Moellerella wisconsensis]|uniref:ATP-dependent nuclease n=1 Tax=Moellerella wisconsensis TaxID=158849 RepID=UPI0030764426
MIHLRQAKRDDYWRTALKRTYPFSMDAINFRDGDIFGNIKLELKPGLNAIIGRNGIGKSNFIRAIYNSLANELSNRRKFPQLLDLSYIDFNLTIDGSEKSWNLSPFEDNELTSGILCFLFDPCSLIPEIQKHFNEQENLDELLDSFESIDLNRDDLSIINFLTNSNYDSVKIINIEDEYESFPMLPYFIVARDEIEYDSRRMGLGELSLLYYYWLYKYMSNYNNSCILIIEEPESFIPPTIQDKLCDVLAMLLAKKGIMCLISTHSEHILKKIPRERIHLMSKIDKRIIFSNATTALTNMGILGLKSPKKGLLFFEDEAALILTQSLIKSSSLYVIDSFYYHISGSESKVLEALNHYPKNLVDFSFIAIFDGDCQKDEITNRLDEYQNYVFLPTTHAPEQIIINYLRSLTIEQIAEILDYDIPTLSMAIDTTRGLDHHDFFLEMARILSKEYKGLFSKLCDSWIKDNIEDRNLKSFILSLESLAK